VVSRSRENVVLRLCRVCEDANGSTFQAWDFPAVCLFRVLCLFPWLQIVPFEECVSLSIVSAFGCHESALAPCIVSREIAASC
jgi:hypothetical protein